MRKWKEERDEIEGKEGKRSKRKEIWPTEDVHKNSWRGQETGVKRKKSRFRSNQQQPQTLSSLLVLFGNIGVMRLKSVPT